MYLPRNPTSEAKMDNTGHIHKILGKYMYKYQVNEKATQYSQRDQGMWNMNKSIRQGKENGH